MTDHFANHSYLRALIVLVAIQVLACRPQTEWAAMEQRFDALTRMERAIRDLPEIARIAVIGTRYEQIATPVRKRKQLDSTTDADLEFLYRAARLAAFYTHDPRHVRDMASFVNELHARGLASGDHDLQLYEAYIGARMLSEARALASQRAMPEREVLPELHEALDLMPGHPTEWRVDPDRRELLRRSADLREPVEVVVVSHPLCHFSKAAVREIQADPVLGPAFEAHAKWLAPQANRLDFDVIQQWNRRHPAQQTTLTFRSDEWPMIDSWATPTFYFLRNGAVVAKVEGWPRQGRRPELVAALHQVGLLP